MILIISAACPNLHKLNKKKRKKLHHTSKEAATILSSLHCVLHVSVSMTSQTLESRTRTLRLVPHENAATALFFQFSKFAGGKKHRLQPQQERSAIQWLWLHSRDQPLQQPCWSVLLRKHQGLQLGCGRSQNHDYCSRGQHQVRFS